MTWLTKLRTRLGYDDVEPAVINYESAQEARLALERARDALYDAHLRREQTAKISSTLADMNHRNHYGESIMLAMMPRERRS